jgi:xylulokinase
LPPPGEYVANGAARQAAWVLAATDDPPTWPLEGVETVEAEPLPWIRRRYADTRELTLSQSEASLHQQELAPVAPSAS